jgi:transcriptional regulator
LGFDAQRRQLVALFVFMYLPKHFEQPDAAALEKLMLEHPLATLVSTGPEGLTANHIPLEFDAASQTLRGHVARANPVWKVAAGLPVMAVFQGPQAYVTPNWYPAKAATHKVVPTWNYAVVHAHGTLVVTEDAPWLHALVSRLTQHHESTQRKPWAVSDAPDDYIQQLLRAIIGIEIPVQRLVGKYKLHQNHTADTRQGVVQGLLQGGQDSRDVAGLMQA